MLEDGEIARITDDLRRKMEKHLGIKARSFERAVRRSGRKLPAATREQAEMLLAAEAMAVNPKLALRLDSGAIRTAQRDVSEYLKQQNLAEQRLTRFLNLLALIVFNLLLVGGLLFLFLRWRGLV